MVRIETKQLILRNFCDADIEDFHAFMKLEITARHEDFDPFTYEQSVESVKRRATSDCHMAVELKEIGKLIGAIGFGVERYDTYAISYDFNPNFQGKGYATEAVHAMVNHIFTKLKGRRVYAECNDDNPGSYRLLERLGFRREGHFLEDVSFKKDTDEKPIYVNSYRYACLSREWKMLEIADERERTLSK